MRARISKRGVFIPRSYFAGADEVEIFPQAGGVFVRSIPAQSRVGDRPANAIAAEPLAGLIAFDTAGEVAPDDPFFHFGKDPINDSDITDASVNLDKYIYG